MVYKPRKVNHRTPSRKVDSGLVAMGGIALFGIFLAVLFYVFRDSTDGKYLSLSSVDPLTYVLFALTGVMLLMTVVSEKAGLASLLICYFLFVSCAFIAILNQSTGIYPWRNLNSPEYVTGTLIVFIAFSTSFIIGKCINLIESRRYKFEKIDRPDSAGEANPVTAGGGNRSFIVFSSAFIFSVLCLIYGATLIIHGRASSEQTDASGLQGQAVSIGRSISFVLMFYSFAMSKNASSLSDAKRWKLIHYFMIFYCLIWSNPFSAARYQFVALCLSLLFLYYKNIGSVAKSSILLGLTFMNFFAFGKIKFLLSQASVAKPDYVFRVDFDSFQCATVVFGHLKNHGLSGISDLLAIIFFFIPRAIWKSKAYSGSAAAFDSFGYPYSNVSYPLPMNLYAMGGYITLVVGGVVIGYFLSAYENRNSQQKSRKAVSYQTLIMATLVGYIPIIMRGSLVSVVNGFGFTLLILGFLAVMSGMRRTRRVKG